MGVGKTFVRLAAVLAVLCFGGPGRAGEVEIAKSRRSAALGFLKDHVELSHGVNVAGTAVSAYGAMVIAPVSRLSQDGWRVKIMGAYLQQKEVTQSVLKCGTNPSLPEDAASTFRRHCSKALAAGSEETEFRLEQTRQVERYEAALMPGYRMTFGALIVKAYAGVGYRGEKIPSASALKDAAKASAGWGMIGARAAGLGAAFGLRGGLESWLTLSDEMWLSADAYYASGVDGDGVYRDAGGTFRAGYQALSWATIGPEAAVFRTESGSICNNVRAGGFLRFDVNGTETTLSGGLASGDGSGGAYGAANVYLRF